MYFVRIDDPGVNHARAASASGSESSALTAVRAVAMAFQVSPEVGLLGSLFGLSTEKGRNAVKQLMNFGELSDQDLYLFVLKMVETQPA